MTTESTPLHKKESHQAFLRLNVCPNNQLHTGPLHIVNSYTVCSIHHTVLQTCKKLVCLNPITTENSGEKSKGSHNMCPNCQSRSKSEVAIMYCYTALQTNNAISNFSAMNPCYFRKASGKSFHTIANRHLVLSAKRTGTKEDKDSTMMLAMCGCCS